jgi:anthranilate synthase component II
MRVLILDNYDSFTYNLYDYVAAVIPDTDVVRNDEVDLSKLDGYSHLILSPGPGLPNESGQLMQVVAQYAQTKPMLGVCLGMQAIGQYFGAELYNQEVVRHGVQTRCQQIASSFLFEDVPHEFEAGLYHSWALRNIPAELKVSCRSAEGVVMGIEHQHLPVFGVQFHPESVLTPHGKQIIHNFLKS